jgi:hypothetical protein
MKSGFGGHRWYAGHSTLLLVLVGAALMGPGLCRASAADIEVRDFTVQVDGKQAGTYRIMIERKDDGSVTMAAESNVQVKVLLVPVYTYAYRGLEVWKGGRLQHLESSGKENSKTFAVNVDAISNGLRVKAQGQDHMARPDVWTTSCWQLPESQRRNQAIPLLGCDDGKELNGHLQQVGTDKITVGGQEQSCSHYRVMKTVPHELWFDGRERLVRDEWVSDGHRTVVELIRVEHR